MNPLDEWVSAEFQNLAEVLYDYDHNLRLEMVPMQDWDKLVDKSKIFRVVDTARNKIVLYADSLSSPQDILARVWSMDQTHNNVIMDLDAKNRAEQALAMRKQIDEMEAQKDFALFVAKNQKSRWKAPDGTIRDEHFNNLGTGRTVID